MTKFALLAKIRAFWVVLRMQGEFCPVLAASKLSGESFGVIGHYVLLEG